MLIPFGVFSAAGAGGGASAGSYDLISTTILGSTTASVTFSGLGTYSGTYKHLQIRYTTRADVDSQTMFGTFNGVTTGSSYASHRLFGDGSTVTSAAYTSRDNFFAGSNETSLSGANSFAAGVLDILDFSSTTKNKTTRVLAGLRGTSNPAIQFQSGLFMSTAAITSITLFGNTGNLVSGSRFSIYGVK